MEESSENQSSPTFDNTLGLINNHLEDIHEREIPIDDPVDPQTKAPSSLSLLQ